MKEQAAKTEKWTALVVLSGAGFTFETACLLQAIKAELRCIYLKTPFGGEPEALGIPSGPCYDVQSFATVTQRSVYSSIAAFIGTFLQTLRILRQHDVDVIIAVGCSHAVPMMLPARILGYKTIFVESITRTAHLSRTGSIVYRLRLASMFIVQWPSLRETYRGSELGTIL